MSKRVQWVLQALVFSVILIAGAWGRSLQLTNPLPMPMEAANALTSAGLAEGLAVQSLPEGTTVRPTLFHQSAATVARFMTTRAKGFHLRYYKVLPFTLSILTLMAVPLLGLRRRGGLFETADSSLWAMAFLAAHPLLIAQGLTFTPWSAMSLLTLALLVTARAYTQWPTAWASALVGVWLVLMMGIDAETAWVIALLLPALFVGIGWTRLKLYWRTWHVLLMLGVTIAGLAGLYFLGARLVPELPALTLLLGGWQGFRLLFIATLGGLGAVAWVALAIWGFVRSDRRWARVFSLCFPLYVLGAIFFPGEAFICALSVLSPVMVAMALSLFPWWWVRTLWCATVLALLGTASTLLALFVFEAQPSKTEQKRTVALLSDTVKATQQKPAVWVQGASAPETAMLLWPLRNHLDAVTVAQEPPTPLPLWRVTSAAPEAPFVVTDTLSLGKNFPAYTLQHTVVTQRKPKQ